jgi:hypothetical protein
MGAAGTRFSRFVPINKTYSETAPTLYTPNPRTISQEIFKRKTFTPAKSINMLAAAWIQFQVHDWFVALLYTTFIQQPSGQVHSWSGERPKQSVNIRSPPNDPLRATGQTNMTVRATVKEAHPGRPNTYRNLNTHWWDLSQLYGADEKTHATLRSFVDGKMKVADDGLLPVGPNGIDITGFTDNWWAGLSLMHNIWTKEHNAVCDMFRVQSVAYFFIHHFEAPDFFV